ncbi:Hypothetical protein CUL131002_0317 [Corynebacterium ulcerans]|nr:Hypothetical protein CUL131002_0317 [Corynebacterium ulcerans]
MMHQSGEETVNLKIDNAAFLAKILRKIDQMIQVDGVKAVVIP